MKERFSLSYLSVSPNYLIFMGNGRVRDDCFRVFKGRKGTIVKLPSGKIALIDRCAVASVRLREKWVCKVKFEKERFAEEYLRLKEELQKVRDWPVENRPVE